MQWIMRLNGAINAYGKITSAVIDRCVDASSCTVSVILVGL